MAFTDDFNRSNRVLGGDNGWQAIHGVLQIVGNEVVETQGSEEYGPYFLNHNGYAAVGRPGGSLDVSVDAYVQRQEGGVQAALFVGATGVDAANTTGIWLEWTDGGYFAIRQLQPDGTSVRLAYVDTDFAASPYEHPGVKDRYRFTYNPTTRQAVGYRNGTQVLEATGNDVPLGTLSGFLSYGYIGSTSTYFVFDDWADDGAAGGGGGTTPAVASAGAATAHQQSLWLEQLGALRAGSRRTGLTLVNADSTALRFS